MKKLIGILCLMLCCILAFSGCYIGYEATINNDGTVTSEETIKLTEEEYNDLISIGGDYSEGFYDTSEFKKVVEGENTYYVYTYKETYSTEEYSLGSATKLTTTEFLSSDISVLSMFSKYIKDSDIKISLTFPTAITVTNGVLSNNNKTVTFDSSVLTSPVYAATSKSTASWAKAANPAAAVKAIIDSYINPFDVPYANAVLNSRIKGTLTWNAVDNATQYYIYKTRNEYDTEGTYVGKTTKTSFKISDLKVGTTYYAVVAANSNWKSYKSFDASFSVMKSAANSTSKPKINSVTASGKKVTIKIKDYSYADGYIIYMSKTGKTGSYKKIGKVADTEGKSYMTFTKKLSKGKYYFKVKAYQKTTAKTYYTKASSRSKKITIK